MTWFAVYTTPRHEKRIATYFTDREIDYYLPLYRSARRWKNRTVADVELPLFPSYIFVRIGRYERVRVLEVPGVLSIVGGREPAPLPEFEIESLRAGLHLRQSEPHPYLVIGERARIRTGALAGMEGVLIRKKNNLRVVLTLDMIMQSVAVEVDADDLEAVGPRPQSVGLPPASRVTIA
jgi:transcription antitermination factor NusG